MCKIGVFKPNIKVEIKLIIVIVIIQAKKDFFIGASPLLCFLKLYHIN